MTRVNIALCSNGNWLINLFVLLYILSVISSQICVENNNVHFDQINDTSVKVKMPSNWPCHWNSGKIPFVFNYYTLTGIRRLIGLVTRGHRFLEKRSCLEFVEVNPVTAAKEKNYTYLFYSFSGVLESCCLNYFKYSGANNGRRLVLLTPLCSMPTEVAHATMHGLGLLHKLDEPFSEILVKRVLFPIKCPNMKGKLRKYYGEL